MFNLTSTICARFWRPSQTNRDALCGVVGLPITQSDDRQEVFIHDEPVYSWHGPDGNVSRPRDEIIEETNILVAYHVRNNHLFLPPVSLWKASVHSAHTRSKSGTSLSIGPKRCLQAFLFHSLRLADVRPERLGLMPLTRHFS